MRRQKEEAGPKDSIKEFERALKESGKKRYLLRLYVAGMTPRSLRAIENIRKICSENLSGRCDLEVIDVYQQPTLAEGEQIIAAPTLIRKIPLPLRRFIGDMANKDRILIGLDVKPKVKRSSPKKQLRPSRAYYQNERAKKNQVETT